ncbi:hypothetical protein PG997_008790 [Apiospora hydei]|uniref:Ankyrin n=1 Tax=Apiospora hydei TaxID=1337664 RepID=A0ABR1WBU9_9PEZI
MRPSSIVASQPVTGPRIFGINASIEVLEAACVHISNNNYPLGRRYIRPIENWVAQVADPMLLQQFFSLKHPTVAAVWERIYEYSVWRNKNASKVLMEVALRIRRGNWLRTHSAVHLRGAIIRADEDTTDRIMELWRTFIGHTEPPKLSGSFEIGDTAILALSNDNLLASMKLMMRQAARHGTNHQDLDDALGRLIFESRGWDVDILQWILHVGVTTNPVVSSWIPPSAQLLPSNWVLFCGPSSFPWTDLQAFFQKLGHGRRPFCSILVKTFVPIWGCVVAAKSGQKSLQQFMRSLHDTTPQEKCVDPEVKLLPRIEWDMHVATKWKNEKGMCYLDLLSQAARKGNLDMLAFLLSYGIWELRHIVGALVAASHAWRPNYMNDYQPALEHEKRISTVALLLDVDLKGIWDEASARRVIPCQECILEHCQERIDHQISSSAEPCAVLYRLFPYDALRKAIRYGFSFDTIEYLVAMGEKVHSERDESGNTMLIDALLSNSRDRYQVVQFLLRRGADPRINGVDMTVLEATLKNIVKFVDPNYFAIRSIEPASGRLDKDEERKVSLGLVNELYDLGSPIDQDPLHQKPRSKPLLVLLIECGAELSLIRQVVTAGANINEKCEDNVTTPLASAIYEDQLEVAEWLLAQGADANLFSCRSIFDRACHMGASFVQLLIEKGADVELPCERHSYALAPLHSAISRGYMDVVVMLLAHGVQINFPRPLFINSPEQYYAVDYAAFYGKLDVLKLLVESGGTSIHPGVSGFDKAFYCGYICGHIGVLTFLEQHTGWSTSTVVSSLKVKGVSRTLGWEWNDRLD